MDQPGPCPGGARESGAAAWLGRSRHCCAPSRAPALRLGLSGAQLLHVCQRPGGDRLVTHQFCHDDHCW